MAMSDQQLSNYLPLYGDRVAVRGFCHKPSASLMKIVMEKMKFAQQESRTSDSRQRLYNNSKTNAVKQTRKIELGWKHKGPDDDKFLQVRRRQARGTRELHVDKEAGKGDLLSLGKQLFFLTGFHPREIL